jgi:hypothetical protein
LIAEFTAMWTMKESGGGAVPVLLAGSEVDDIARVYIDDRLAFFLRPSFPAHDVKELTPRVSMPVGAGAGLEENAEEACVGERTSGRRVHPHDA